MLARQKTQLVSFFVIVETDRTPVSLCIVMYRDVSLCIGMYRDVSGCIGMYRVRRRRRGVRLSTYGGTRWYTTHTIGGKAEDKHGSHTSEIDIAIGICIERVYMPIRLW